MLPTTDRWISRVALGLGISFLSLTGCSSAQGEDLDPVEEPGTGEGGLSGSMPVGTVLTTTADLNLRKGPSTSDSVLTVLPRGSQVAVVQADPVNGFYNVTYQSFTGWSSGKYLSAEGSTGTPVAGGQVWEFRAKKLAVDVAVFVPAAAAEASEVDVLFYAHGLNVCSPVAKDPPLSFVTDEPFRLGAIVDATQRPIVLVVPFLDWERLGANGMAFNGSNHRIGIPSNLNGVVAEVLEQVGQRRSTAAPSLSSLLLAGHSRAYSFLNPLAAANADPQMATGALAKLSHVWGFDSSYACSPLSAWTSWMASKPSLHVEMFYRAGTGTASCGGQFANLVPSSDGQLEVHVAAESHCAVPATRLPGLLGDLP